MIVNVPSPEGFRSEAINSLNLAWSIVIELCDHIGSYSIVEDVLDRDLLQEHARKSQYILRNAITLIQQAQEFALKAKICNVSPFLLISGSPTNWPQPCDEFGVDFSVFRSVNAADLPLVHDTVCSPSLSQRAKQEFARVRLLRNAVVHGAGGPALHLPDIIKLIVRTHEGLLSNGLSWLQERRRHLDNDEAAALFSSDYAANQLSAEFDNLRAALPRRLVKGLFGFDSSLAQWICPYCVDDGKDWNDYPVTANPRRSGDGGFVLWCALCNREIPLRTGVCENGCGESLIIASGEYEGRCPECSGSVKSD